MTAPASGSPAVGDLPAEVAAWIGVPRYEEVGDVAVERGAIWTTLAATENGNPLYWDDEVARVLTGGPVAPPTTLSTWFRPHLWAPGRAEPRLPLQVHFDLKERLGLPEAVIADNTVVFHRPLRPGDVVHTRQLLRSVSGEKRTRLGTGRFWTIDVEVATADGELAGVETYTGFGYRRPAGGAGAGSEGTTGAGSPAGAAAGDGRPAADTAGSLPDRGAAAAGEAGHQLLTPRRLLGSVTVGEVLPPIRHPVTATTVVLGALASRDWRPMHHDRDFAIERNGTRDIFLNTPTQAAWFERLITDWTGPHGRLGRLRFQMLASVFPGDTMVVGGTVTATSVDERGCGWATVAVTVEVGGTVCTSGEVSVALPVGPDDNPWARGPEAWAP